MFEKHFLLFFLQNYCQSFFMHGYSKVLFGKKTNKTFCLSSEPATKEINFLHGIWLKIMYAFPSSFFLYSEVCLSAFILLQDSGVKKNHKYLWETTAINQQANFTGPYGILASKIMEFSWNWDTEGMEMTFLSLGFFTCRKQNESLCIFFRYLETNLWFKCIIKNITSG